MSQRKRIGSRQGERETGLKRVMVPCSGNKDGKGNAYALGDARCPPVREKKKEREREQSHSQGKFGVTLPLIANSVMMSMFSMIEDV